MLAINIAFVFSKAFLIKPKLFLSIGSRIKLISSKGRDVFSEIHYRAPTFGTLFQDVESSSAKGYFHLKAFKHHPHHSFHIFMHGETFFSLGSL
ncbi:hypothetical protein GDO81_004817 [Engystomops pustulosus]|uniref:Uncharacterized protein n=1 Tax=Engystomops pustulosus TaxID=76066 RepID=A0AAV7CIT1_ENGPU|nr:hypothetical protein GDO81_004817 [Engystomops pustulosus]